LNQLLPCVNNSDFISRFTHIKRQNKERLKKWVKENTGYDIPLDSLYDV
jgi:glucan phosphorylase